MENELKKSILLNAEPDAVWDMLTNPDKIEQYMFGSRINTDWQPGSKVDFYMPKAGQEIIVVTGEVIRSDQPRLLEHTLFPVGSTMEDIPENYLTVTYELLPVDGGTELTVSQRDFSSVAQGEKRYQDSQNGWKLVLPKMKEIVEQE